MVLYLVRVIEPYEPNKKLAFGTPYAVSARGMEGKKKL